MWERLRKQVNAGNCNINKNQHTDMTHPTFGHYYW